MSDLSAPIIKRVEKALLPLTISDGTDSIQREGQRVASVLMPLVERQIGWQVILTQRPITMPRHPGQISFPGGRREAGETALQAALRETEEEVGLKPDAITPLGRLPSFNAVSEYRVTPFVGVVEQGAKIIRDEREVEEVFEVPLNFILNANNHIERNVFFDGRDHRLFDMPYDEPEGVRRNIWGMTAMIMRRLYERGFS